VRQGYSAQTNYIKETFRSGPLSTVEQCESHLTEEDDESIGLNLMDMPPVDVPKLSGNRQGRVGHPEAHSIHANVVRPQCFYKESTCILMRDSSDGPYPVDADFRWLDRGDE
jgi:hypothetical protein